MAQEKRLHIGTCSWKYGSWKGLVYSKEKPANFLKEYSARYSAVEVDQWFWSLFGDSAVLPKADIVREYCQSVPEDFLFAVKVPNSITLTHHYRKNSRGPLIANEHFLSIELMEKFLETLEPMRTRLGPLMFQFEYLNKQKMGGQVEFFDRVGEFVSRLPKGPLYTVETRNPNYLNSRYFQFLKSLSLTHIFLHGYYMPPIFDVYEKHKSLLGENAVIRLHGPARQDIEKLTGNKWGEIVAPKDDDLDRLALMLDDIEATVFLFVNNHFEGSAPRTIARIERRLAARKNFI